jgi:hypothetical protein
LTATWDVGGRADVGALTGAATTAAPPTAAAMIATFATGTTLAPPALIEPGSWAGRFANVDHTAIERRPS